ncbi:hypothetical protein CTAYLR_002186 [Chrysophaeum taylorii]|uniref:Potassium channel domain-containing protein n=1 Tax=Chrysophaeum taylorii TaxID=2483200 RepID=A0AAD7UN88_9STRA|nr:hypothetical protein CTAYLR_002186 [Chrysophaeum taylorii]
MWRRAEEESTEDATSLLTKQDKVVSTLEDEDERSRLGPSISSLFSLRNRQRKAFRQILDMTLICGTYFFFGSLFYRLTNKEFTWRYAFFYAVNVGLGVGYGDLHIRDTFTKWFTCGYVLVGSSVVVSALTLFLQLAQQRLEDDKLGVAFLFYACCLVGGVYLGFAYENAQEFVDALLFSMSNYTTAGLIVPRNNYGMYWVTWSLLVGVPANMVLMGQVANRFLAGYDDEDDDNTTRRPLDDDAVPAYTSWLEDKLLTTAAISPDKLQEIRASFLGPLSPACE